MVDVGKASDMVSGAVAIPLENLRHKRHCLGACGFPKLILIDVRRCLPLALALCAIRRHVMASSKALASLVSAALLFVYACCDSSGSKPGLSSSKK
jgi:hypothetical protein